jgi:ABC-type Mn2+/Zn2+ transport system ATPase subunit
MADEDLVTFKEVEVGYHRRRLLPPVDLVIHRGASLGIVGPNGSGKTTLLRTMLGLIPPVRGKVSFAGGRRPSFGYVPQGESVDKSFPAEVRDVVMMGRYVRIKTPGAPGKADREAVDRALERVNLAAQAKRAYGALSGGQRQRVLVARALCAEPEILVLDEPTTGMDIVAEDALLELVTTACEQLGIAVIFVSHALSSVANTVKELLLLDRERLAIEYGPVGEVMTSERLSRLYGRAVRVFDTEGGQRVVMLEHGKPEAPTRKQGER